MDSDAFAAFDNELLKAFLEDEGFDPADSVSSVKARVASGDLLPRALYDYLTDGNRALFEADITGPELYRMTLANTETGQTQPSARGCALTTKPSTRFATRTDITSTLAWTPPMSTPFTSRRASAPPDGGALFPSGLPTCMSTTTNFGWIRPTPTIWSTATTEASMYPGTQELIGSVQQPSVGQFYAVPWTNLPMIFGDCKTMGHGWAPATMKKTQNGIKQGTMVSLH